MAETWRFEIELSAMPTPAASRTAQMDTAPWGSSFSDHMVSARFDPARGWVDTVVTAHRPLVLAPGSSVLHYGQAVFEGLKAYRQPDDQVALFRPEINAQRFVESAQRLAMAPVPPELFLAALDALIQVDEAWVPVGSGRSLYLRPMQFATDVSLMTQPSSHYRFLVIASPVRSYFSDRVDPVSVWISEDHARAMPGGTGAVKASGNYGAAMLAQHEAKEHGCDQVIWLDAATKTHIEEMGGMNLFFVIDGRLVTPALMGTLLPGVTRRSIIELATAGGLDVEERLVTRHEVEHGIRSGSISEAFACGTAAVVTPIGWVKHRGGSLAVGDASPGEITLMLRESLLGIQEGTLPDPNGWMRPVGAPTHSRTT